MDSLTYVYLAYSFITIYFFSLFILIYVQNKKQMWETLKPEKEYALSIVVPCFNAEKEIGETIETLLKSDYKGLKKIIVVDDCSTDNSYKIIKEYEKKYSRVLGVQTPKNSGCAAGAKNYGAQFVKTELIGFTDDDSRPEKDAISKMVGFFNDKKAGAVTSRVLVKNKTKLLPKFQAIEYKVIAFTRKLLEFVGGIYVTNGPLSVYRKSAFDEVGGFDKNNLTEDIEITWHIVSKKYNVYMSMCSVVYTIAPETMKMWFRQRIRWNVGGIQTINKYKTKIAKTGMLGSFILPFFVLSWLISLTGLFILTQRYGRELIVQILNIRGSAAAQTAILRFSSINLTPNVLVFFGLAIMVAGLFFTITSLSYSKEKNFKRYNLLTIAGYSMFYLLAYPPLLIISMYKFARGYNTW